MDMYSKHMNTSNIPTQNKLGWGVYLYVVSGFLMEIHVK